MLADSELTLLVSFAIVVHRIPKANMMPVTGVDEYEEDSWKAISLYKENKLERCQFDVSCRTVRLVKPTLSVGGRNQAYMLSCKLPNVDPATGIRHKVEPDRALRKFRDVDEGAPKMGCLGMQMCPVFAETDGAEDLQSFIETGMRIDVLQLGSHKYIKQ